MNKPSCTKRRLTILSLTFLLVLSCNEYDPPQDSRPEMTVNQPTGQEVPTPDSDYPIILVPIDMAETITADLLNNEITTSSHATRTILATDSSSIKGNSLIVHDHLSKDLLPGIDASKAQRIDLYFFDDRQLLFDGRQWSWFGSGIPRLAKDSATDFWAVIPFWEPVDRKPAPTGKSDRTRPNDGDECEQSPYSFYVFRASVVFSDLAPSRRKTNLKTHR